MLEHKLAQEFLLTWYKYELTYVRDFRVWRNKSRLDWAYENGFTEALYYFEVPGWDDSSCVRRLMNLTYEFVQTPVGSNVDKFARKLTGLFDDNPTSLAAKILFLSNPQKITPISTSVRAAVGLKADTYSRYHELFIEFRDKHIKEISESLREIEPVLSRIEDEFDEIPKLKSVRTNRYTDQLLRFKGHEILDQSAVYGPPTSETEKRITRDYVQPPIIAALRTIDPSRFDATRLVCLCDELNICFANGRAPEVEMLVRSIAEQVLPIFGVTNFANLSSAYPNGSPEFRRSIIRLGQQRALANYWLHCDRRSKSSLPAVSESHFTAEINALLEEVLKILKRK